MLAKSGYSGNTCYLIYLNCSSGLLLHNISAEIVSVI
jgi:hypothetical protein